MKLVKVLLRISLAVLFFFSCLAHVKAQSGWQCSNPNPQPDDLRTGYTLSGNIGFMAGKGGTILKTINGGTSWNVVYKNLSLNINSLSFWTVNSATAVCDGGKILRTSNLGDTWVLSPTIFEGTGGDLYRIQFPDATVGFASGDSGRVYKTTDGGNTWDFRTIDGPSAKLKGLYFINSQTGWVATSNGLVLRTTDGWDTWEEANTGLLNDIVNVFFINTQTGWVTGQAFSSNFKGFIFKSTDGGASWPTTQTFSPLANQYITDVTFETAQRGIAIGQNGIFFSTTNGGTNWTLNTTLTANSLYYARLNGSGKSYIIGDGGLILSSTNSGTSWQSNSIFNDVKKMKFVNAQTGFIAGNQKDIYKTSDAGATWTTFSTGAAASFNDISMADASTGWVCGSAGALRKTTNGGINWTDQSSGLGSYNYYSSSFIHVHTGWVCGSSSIIYKTNNGGINWSSLPFPSGNNLIYIYFENLLNGVTISNDQKRVFTTTNSGTNWNSVYQFGASDSVNSAFFINAQTGWVTGQNVVYKTNNGGTSWNSSPAISSTKINGVYFVNPSLGWCTGNNGKAAVSTNGGASWTAQPVVGLTNFNFPYFIDANTGWITGANNVLMKTTNGGNVFVTHLSSEIPEKFSLHQNYPNPFNPATNIKFDVRKSSHVNLKVYDMQGREISELVNEELTEGFYQVSFNAKNFASGIYFYTLKSDNFSETKKMIFVK